MHRRLLPLLLLPLLAACTGLPQGARLIDLTEAAGEIVAAYTPTPVPTPTATPAPRPTPLAGLASPGEVLALTFSPAVDRAMLAAEAGLFLFRDSVWLPIDSPPVTALEWSPDGQNIVTGGSDGQVRLLDSVTAQVEFEWAAHTVPVADLAFSPDSERFASVASDGSLALGALGVEGAASVRINGASLNSVAWSPEADRIVGAATFANGLGALTLWDAQTLEEVGGLLQPVGVSAVAWSADWPEIALGRSDGAILLWDPETGYLRSLVTLDQPVRALAFSPEETLTVLDDSGALSLYHLPTGALAREFIETIDAFTWDSEQTTLFVYGNPGGAVTWQFPELTTAIEATAAPVPTAFSLAAEGLSLSGLNQAALDLYIDGDTIAAGGSNDRSVVWDAANSAAAPRTVFGPGVATGALAYSPDGALIASQAPNFNIRLWESSGASNPARIEQTLPGHGAPVTALAWSPDGTQVASGSNGGQIILWDVASAEALFTLDAAHAGAVSRLAFSPGGDLLASGGFDGQVVVWSVEEGEEAYRIEAGGIPRGLAFSGDGALLALGTDQSSDVQLFEAGSGEPAGLLSGHAAPIAALAFSPSDDSLASADTDGQVIVWAAAYGQRRFVLEAAGTVPSVLRFDPAGAWLVAGAANGAVTAWAIGE